MRTVLALVLFLSGTVSQLAAGQEASDQAKSFDMLRYVLEVGQEVKVRDETGRSTKGKVVSITETELVVSRKRVFRPRVEHAFTADLTERIEVVDSGWNGAVIGGAAALGLVATVVKVDCNASCDKSGSWAVGVLTLVPIGIAIGGAIDSVINKTIYDRHSQKSRITVVPWFEPGRKGLLIRALF